MKNCGHRNIRKHRDIKDSDKYITWTYRWSLAVWTRWELHLQIEKIIWEDQGRGWLPLWVSRPKKGQINTKRKGILSELSLWRTFQILSGILKKSYKSYERSSPKHYTTGSYFYLAIQILKCMMRADALNLENYPVRT